MASEFDGCTFRDAINSYSEFWLNSLGSVCSKVVALVATGRDCGRTAVDMIRLTSSNVAVGGRPSISLITSISVPVFDCTFSLFGRVSQLVARLTLTYSVGANPREGLFAIPPRANRTNSACNCWLFPSLGTLYLLSSACSCGLLSL
ncbi:hypothetical protein J6590_080642 [Homalodisca vitripennis]|nr:hypothetical protein J6590_080642 [Homalodisca vitripennis]